MVEKLRCLKLIFNFISFLAMALTLKGLKSRCMGLLESVGVDRLGDALLGLLLEQTDLVRVGLEQHAHPVGVVVHGEVCEPGAGVGVHHDLVPAVHVDDDVLAGHRVLVVVLVVLVEDRGDLLA